LREDPSAEIQTQDYPNWGIVSTITKRHQGKGGEVIWWDGLRGGHNDIGWAEGSIDLIKRIGGL
jgi:abhydrolase domain-containing protein 12